jgi:hypothetical protein
MNIIFLIIVWPIIFVFWKLGLLSLLWSIVKTFIQPFIPIKF